MSRRNPSFIGERMTEAREARGWNQVQLAEALGITRQAISQYEKGVRTPTWDILDRASKCLHFPVHRFVQPSPSQSQDPVFFRSYAASTKSARMRAHRRLGWIIHDICGFIREFIDLPIVNFPRLDLPNDPLAMDYDMIERSATHVRRFWNLGDGPISDIVLLLENNGAIIAQQELDVSTLDAFSRWDSGESRPYIVLGLDKPSAVRSRLNTAHELGHMVLHRHLRPNIVSRPEVHKLLEKQAMYFGGAFLLPAKTFAAEIPRPNLNAFVMIKTRWRVAIQAMIIRAEHLDVISAAEKERLFTYLSQRKWRKQEPYDDELEIEKPRLLERSFDLVLREGLATTVGIEAATGMYACDIESTLGFERGFFREDISNLKFSQARRISRV